MARIGFTTCKTCGNPEASVSETKTGTLSIGCHRCELSSYAKAGSKAARLIRADLRLDEDAAPAADNPPAPKERTPEEKAAAANKEMDAAVNKKKAFSLGNL